jgi:hypothetical protein
MRLFKARVLEANKHAVIKRYRQSRLRWMPIRNWKQTSRMQLCLLVVLNRMAHRPIDALLVKESSSTPISRSCYKSSSSDALTLLLPAAPRSKKC